MTDSTNPPAVPASEPVKVKKVKGPPGPIRTGVVVPLLIIGLGTFLYFKFLFDANLRWVMEFAGTKINGAEVNVRDFRSSFLDGSFELSGLEVTDKENPATNILEIKTIASKLLWDGLLRGKFVIDNFAIKGISWQSPRKSPGKVLPVEPEKPADNTPSAAGKIAGEAKSAALEEAQKEFKGNALGDLAAILEGGDTKEQLGEIRETLESEKYITGLEQELTTKQKMWEEKIKALPTKEEFESIAQKIKDTKLDSNPLAAAKQLKEFKDDFNKLNQTVKLVKEGGKEITASVKMVESSIKKIDDLVEQDLKNLQTRFKIPSLDTKNLAQGLFGPFVLAKLGKSKKYLDMAREYLPPKKSAAEKAKDELAKPKPRPRARGVDYRFPKRGAYPLVWLKNIEISSEAPKDAQGGTQGNLKGKGSNFTTDPQVVGKPMVLTIAGNFPGAKIYDMTFNAALNHHLPTANEEVTLSVGDYPISQFVLSKSEKLKFGLAQAHGVMNVNLKHSEEMILMNIGNRFRKVDYLVESQNKKVAEILSSLLRGIPEITLDAMARGTWASLTWDFKSNLGEELASGLKREINERVGAAKEKLRKMLDDKIGPKRKMIEGKYAQIKGKLDSLVGDREKQIDDAKNKAQAALDDKVKSNTGGAEDKGKAVLKGLKKKFKL